MRFVAAVVIGLLVGGAVAASAQEGPDADAVRSVIAGQIDAFRAGDRDLAYSFAAPGIQQMFPSPRVFMRMVEEGYEPVYRPRSFAFLPVQLDGDQAVQLVDVVGPDGAAWIAIYTLRRQADGSWKITGCHLKPGTGA